MRRSQTINVSSPLRLPPGSNANRLIGIHGLSLCMFVRLFIWGVFQMSWGRVLNLNETYPVCISQPISAKVHILTAFSRSFMSICC